MAKVEVPECDQSEIEKIESWRLHQLIGAGYAEGNASTLSRADYVDLHEALELVVERGCPPEIATMILL